VYLFLGTGNATTGLILATGNAQTIVPYYNAAVSGFTSSSGLIGGTGTGITLAAAVPTLGIPIFLLH
jgi:hypothetical protein